MKLLSDFKSFQTSSQPKAMFIQFLGITLFLFFCSMKWSVVFKTFPLKGKVYLFVLCCFHPETADVKPGHDLRKSHVSGLIAFHTQPGMSYLQLKRVIEKKNYRKPLKKRFSSTKYLFLPLLHSSFACWTLENNILTHINDLLRYVKSQSWSHVHSNNINIHLLKL